MKTTLQVQGKDVGIEIARGLFERIGVEIRKAYGGDRVFVLTDSNVGPLYGGQLSEQLVTAGFAVTMHVEQAGEGAKRLNRVEAIYSKLLEAGFTRGDLLVVLGGGVPGDLGGFVAATYLRGIRYIQVPTTLLAQVDSSIGGKVGINLQEGKNLAGSFYHPERVFIDPDLLKTLPQEEFRSGMAEVIKYGCILDEKLFGLVGTYHRDPPGSRDDEILETLIARSAASKIEIVAEDEKESGRRMLLNFGHTLGHGLEKNLGYGAITHGQAVAVGMYRFTLRSEAEGITEAGTAERLAGTLRGAGLSLDAPQVDRRSLLETIRADKKSRGKTLHIVLIRRIGQGLIREIPADDIERYL